ncbi:hypothetical protein STCU_11520 [Strigomonas culicis]|uniref:Uncharacterized protein n=1 Tax=Strigomonas culicis TaxID=28005 RepID=S9TGY0_9TRYP|nr:hypothetical protein STCU_11520 [Strigomonas culicis]|eukprot:EPY16149.1 hypothetical protein STCU_11520 [Strigomonas culicis]
MPPAASRLSSLWEACVRRRRDFFFGCVALLALASVVRNELMKKGVVARPTTQQLHPQAQRQFGRENRRREKIE